jgi:hypothetical protein
MGDSATITLRPSLRTFLLWSALLFGVVIGSCALYHMAWPLAHPIRNGQVADYIAGSALTCLVLALFMLIFYLVPASVVFVLQRTFWEAWPDGVAIYRKGKLSREVPWEKLARVSPRPAGIRLYVRTRVESAERLLWVPWSEARSFARYCNEQASHLA